MLIEKNEALACSLDFLSYTPCSRVCVCVCVFVHASFGMCSREVHMMLYASARRFP